MIDSIRKIIPARFKERLKVFRYKIAGFFLNIFEPILGRYITFHTRPIYAAGVLTEPGEINNEYSEYAIVMQGPIAAKQNFTLETLLLYKRYFPGALIVLSTWNGEDPDTMNEIRSAGMEVILNKKPDHAGPININMQIVSATAGIRRVAEAGKKYVLKTRTDERIYSSNSLIFLANLLRRFPITARDCKQKGRLIGPHGSIQKLYFFPDMLVFGYTEDVLMYYGADLVIGASFPPNSNGLPFAAEQYFFTEFLKKIGYQMDHTIENSLRAQAGHGIIIDAASLDWYWHKYERHREYRHITYRRKKRSLGFADWLNLYSSYDKL